MATFALIETAGWIEGGAPPLSRLAGRTLLAQVVESARRSRAIERLVVLSDDPEVGSEADRLGLRVDRDPGAIGEGRYGLARAVAFASGLAAGRSQPPANVVLSIGPGAALLLPEDFDRAAEAVGVGGADTAILARPWAGDVWRREASAKGVPTGLIKPLLGSRDDLLLDSGALYAIRGGWLSMTDRDGFGTSSVLEIPPDRVAALGGRFDIRAAERLLLDRHHRDRLASLPSPPTAVVFDFDGVMTDNKVYVMQDGREAVACNRSDGWGLSQLKKTGIPLLVLSTERNPVVRARCDKVGIPCLHGYEEKSIALRQWFVDNQIDPAGVIYLGNDVNDLPSMKIVGYPVAVGDAYPEVIAVCRLVLSASGGSGAVRELADLILRARQANDPHPG